MARSRDRQEDRRSHGRGLTADELLGLPEDEFRAVVDTDLRRRGDPETNSALRSAAVIDRTYEACLRILRSIEGQFAARNAEVERSRAVFSRRRRDLERGISNAERRLARAERHKISDVDEAKAALERVQDDYLAFGTELADTRVEEAEWRASAVRFKTGLEEDLIKLRSIRNSYRDKLYDAVVTEERDRLAMRVRQLEAAIRAHHDHECDNRCDSECVADQALWGTVLAGSEVQFA